MHTNKEDLFNSNDYIYHFGRSIYYNKNSKKIFSKEYIDDHDYSFLMNKINENNIDSLFNDWKFYFNTLIDENYKQSILDEIQNQFN